MRLFILPLASLLLCSCQNAPNTSSTLEELQTREVTMPNGKTIRAEAMMRDQEMARGMMFRDALPPGRGMLFLHQYSSNYEYWMYQVKVPLDVIFMDPDHRVLGVSANTPPCTTRASDCPKYGGYSNTRYVLELAGGEAAKYGVERGRVIGF